MTMQQVEQILGKPTSVKSVDILGLSGSSATWQNHNAVIIIQFLNNAVQIKTLNKINDKNSNVNVED